MSGEEMERAIEFLVDQMGNVSANIGKLTVDIEGLKESINGLKEAQERTTANISSLTGVVVDLAESISRLETQAEINRKETRDAINNLILANEVTRDLSQNVARLAIGTSQRVAALEEKLG